MLENLKKSDGIRKNAREYERIGLNSYNNRENPEKSMRIQQNVKESKRIRENTTESEKIRENMK